ncbi:hypothetical protein [Algoriphagus sp. Y33]|uniref:hypothetical protein n=1 Tax=Algoriphagus sp. Y33 TaxID=2772483 RepID=UPI00177E2F25|nr:hypothetical protein [Algoriphagus sp. Y33]
MKNSNPKKNHEKPTDVEEWDLSEGMGILPTDIPFTQNIGCVGAKIKKPDHAPEKTNKN